MSRPRYDWWAYVKGMIRRYPSLCVEEKALHDISISPDLSGLPHGTGKHSDPVANAAMRELPPISRHEMEAVQKALETTQWLDNGKDRLQMIKMVFWDKKYTVAGAALKLGYSERTVVQWHGDFIRLTARNFGLM